MDGAEFLFIILVGFIVLFMVCSVVYFIVDIPTQQPIDETITDCVIVHMDIDGGKFYITVKKDDFSKAIKVTSDVYANHKVGDIVTVRVSGYRSVFDGERVEYKIKD